MEALAFQSLSTVPVDMGCPPGTSEWIKLLGWPVIIIHYPALILNVWSELLLPWKPALCVVGYVDSLIVISVIVFLWRVGLSASSPRCHPNSGS
jgi:hypothetical protein